MSNKYQRAFVIVKDSLGVIVSRYATKIDPQSLAYKAEFDPESKSYILDCEVDGELGWKEIYLNYSDSERDLEDQELRYNNEF